MDDSTGRTRSRCPICGRPAEQRWRPFCSRRCADVDLNRWLGGAYAVPAVGDDEDDGSVPDDDSSGSDAADGDRR